MNVNIYLDDVRDTPKNFIRCYTVNDCISLIKEHDGNIGILSLDNDLGEDQIEGYKVLDFLEEEVFFNRLEIPNQILIHSANPVAVDRMKVIINNINNIKKCN